MRPRAFFAASVTVAVSHATVVQWGTCRDDFGSPSPVDCGRLFVPLDYTETDGETLSLELLRVPAERQPAKGSILLNFGGPGAPGRSSLAASGPRLQMLSGGHYNLIAFDPRGTGDTIPFNCLQTETEKLEFITDFMKLPRVQDKAALGRFWSRSKIFSEQCQRRQNKTGELLGSAFVARDLLSVAESLGEDGLLRYWGFSYGTTLGATLVSMFPDKVDKVILDGVQNPHEYYHAYADMEEWSDSDEEFSHIFQHCVKNKDKCAFARNDATADQLEQSVWELLDTLTYDPTTVGDLIVDRGMLAAKISSCLYSTNTWPNLTTVLDMLIEGNRDDDFLLEAFGPMLNMTEQESDISEQEAVIGIHCSDRAARAGSLEKLMPTLEKLANVSRVMDGLPDGINVPCALWKFQPKERYEGDFQVTPRKPVLIIGNTWDGLTPLRSAHNVSSGFEGSVVLEVNGYGHASIGLPSACSLKAMRAYWNDGALPEPGSVCKVDAPPFSNITWDDVLRDLDNGDDLAPDEAQLELK